MFTLLSPSPECSGASSTRELRAQEETHDQSQIIVPAKVRILTGKATVSYQVVLFGKTHTVPDNVLVINDYTFGYQGHFSLLIHSSLVTCNEMTHPRPMQVLA